MSLGRIGNRQAVDALITALPDEAPYVGKSAAIALGMIKDPRAVEPLITALKSNVTDGYCHTVKCGAVIAMGMLKDTAGYGTAR